jgi:hypothetical protein
MKLGKWMLAGTIVLMALPGCGGSDDDTATPTEKCEALINRFCGSAIGCQVKGGLIEASAEASENETCRAGASQVVECSKAQSVSSNYDACMSKLANPPCDDVNQAIMDGSLGLPTECNGVILIN